MVASTFLALCVCVHLSTHHCVAVSVPAHMSSSPSIPTQYALLQTHPVCFCSCSVACFQPVLLAALQPSGLRLALMPVQEEQQRQKEQKAKEAKAQQQEAAQQKESKDRGKKGSETAK